VEFFSGGKLWRERTRALAKTGNFSHIFGEFLECLEWLGPNRKIFFGNQGSCCNTSNTQGLQHNLQ
jgi:hypothetical protein